MVLNLPVAHGLQATEGAVLSSWKVPGEQVAHAVVVPENAVPAPQVLHTTPGVLLSSWYLPLAQVAHVLAVDEAHAGFHRGGHAAEEEVRMQGALPGGATASGKGAAGG